MACEDDALKISPRDMYALSVFSIFEGSPNLLDVNSQLQVAAVAVNRLNSSNWVEKFGNTMTDQHRS